MEDQIPEKQKRVSVVVALLVLILLFIAGALLFGFFEKTDTVTTTEENDEKQTVVEGLPDGVQAELIKEGEVAGAVAVEGKLVTVHYVGRLQDGTVFDSSYDRGEAFSFLLGAGQVIQGWDLGVKGMRVGESRLLTLAPEYAYGDRAIGSIPANSTLIFEVELLEVSEPVGSKG